MVQQLPFSVGVGIGTAIVAIAVPVQAQVSQITDIEVVQTDAGLQIVLDAEGISESNIFETSFGNTLVLDITSAQLAAGAALIQENPVEGIEAITVEPLDSNSVRVRIVGATEVPAVAVATANAGLVIGVTSAIATTPEAETIPLDPETLPAETAARPTEGGGESPPSSGNGSGNNPGTRAVICRNCVEPEYPQSALEAGAEGRTRVSVQINPDGSVASVTLLRSSGNAAIDQAAIRAAQQSSFQPIARGASVSIQYDLSIERSQQYRDDQRRGERQSTEVADPPPPEQPAQTGEEPTPAGETATESVPPDSTPPQEDSVGDSPEGSDEDPADPSEPEDSGTNPSPEPDPADRPAVSGESGNDQESEPVEPSDPAQSAPTPAPLTPENSENIDLPEPVAPPPEVEPVAPATPEPTPEPVEPAPEPEPAGENAPEEDNS